MFELHSFEDVDQLWSIWNSSPRSGALPDLGDYPIVPVNMPVGEGEYYSAALGLHSQGITGPAPFYNPELDIHHILFDVAAAAKELKFSPLLALEPGEAKDIIGGIGIEQYRVAAIFSNRALTDFEFCLPANIDRTVIAVELICIQYGLQHQVRVRQGEVLLNFDPLPGEWSIETMCDMGSYEASTYDVGDYQIQRHSINAVDQAEALFAAEESILSRAAEASIYNHNRPKDFHPTNSFQ